MPFRVSARGIWRGQVRHQKKTLWKDFDTKKEAVEWEVKIRQELTRELTRTGTDLASFANEYLDYVNLHFV